MEKDTIGIAKSVPRDVSHEETSTASLPPHKTDSRRILIPSPSSDPHDPLVSDDSTNGPDVFVDCFLELAVEEETCPIIHSLLLYLGCHARPTRWAIGILSPDRALR